MEKGLCVKRIWPVHDEAEAEGVLFQKIQTAAQFCADLPRQLGGSFFGVSDEEDHVAGLKIRPGAEFFPLIVA